MSLARVVGEHAVGIGVGREQDAREDSGQPGQVGEVEALDRVVLGVVVGAVPGLGERRDVDARHSGREERPDLGERVRLGEPETMRQEPVAGSPAEDSPDEAGKLGRGIGA